MEDAGAPGQAEPQAVGVEVTDSGIPRIRSTLRLSWGWNDWSFGYAFRYISSLKEDCGSAGGFAVEAVRAAPMTTRCR